jgi:hypothetical protein
MENEKKQPTGKKIMGSTQTTATEADAATERRQLIFALHYGRRYGMRLGRLAARAAGALRFGEIVLGSGAMLAFVSGSASAAAWCGLGVAAIGAINIAFDPADKASLAREGSQAFGKLLSQAHGLDLAALRSAVLDLQANTLPEIDALREPVWRDVLLECEGHQEAKPMRRLERLMDAMA